MLAILSNSAYLKGDQAFEGRKQEIEALNQHYDQLIESVRDPFKAEREYEELMSDPVMAAGIRGFERLRWEMGVTPQTQHQLEQMREAS